MLSKYIEMSFICEEYRRMVEILSHALATKRSSKDTIWGT